MGQFHIYNLSIKVFPIFFIFKIAYISLGNKVLWGNQAFFFGNFPIYNLPFNQFSYWNILYSLFSRWQDWRWCNTNKLVAKSQKICYQIYQQNISNNIAKDHQKINSHEKCERIYKIPLCGWRERKHWFFMLTPFLASAIFQSFF